LFPFSIESIGGASKKSVIVMSVSHRVPVAKSGLLAFLKFDLCVQILSATGYLPLFLYQAMCFCSDQHSSSFEQYSINAGYIKPELAHFDLEMPLPI